MKYTVNDIPYLVGLHFVLTNSENDTVFLIESYRSKRIYIDWPYRNRDRQAMATYSENGFLFHLNSGHWKIIDLPDVSNIDISSVIKEDEDEEPELKAGDVVYFKNNEERPYDEEEFKVGKPYQIDYISYRGDVIEIFNERGYASEFTIYPDYNGFSFKSWFTIIPPDIQNTDFFSKLYESNDTVKERGKILKFNPRPTPEEEQMIYNRLTEMYPSIRWSSSGEKLSNRSYSRLKLDTLFIENKKHVTWGAGPDADEVYLESPHYWDLYDGWNFINGKSTSEIFDTLYEQEDDGLGWAKETVKTPITLGSLWEYKTLNVGDVVALYGDVMDSERVLFILTGENFVVEDIQYKKEVYRIGDNLDDINRILFKWLKPIQERPINWKSAASGNSFEVDSSTISNDGKILVQFISRAQKE